MYSLYDDGEYKQCVDECVTKLNSYKSFKILEEVYPTYRHFLDKNKELIDSFKGKVDIDKTILCDIVFDNKEKAEYDIFKELKTSIELFKKKLNWDVPYYVEFRYILGDEERYVPMEFKGIGHVGEVVSIEHIEDERFIIKGPSTIKLKFEDNIATLIYTLKNEYRDKLIENNDQKKSDYKNQIVKFEKNQRYNIEFEAYAPKEALLSCLIIRRTSDNCEIVFAQDELKIGREFRKYAFEFIYNGETEDSNYLTFGYGNEVCGFLIRYVKITKVE